MAKKEVTKFWWLEKKEEDKLAALRSAKDLIKNDDAVLRRAQYHWQLYRNQLVKSSDVYEYTRYNSSDNTTSLSYNVVKTLCDTAVSKITANKPRPRILTDDGSWSDQEKAMNLEKFVDGQFCATKFYEMAPQAMLDAAIFGTGFIKIFEDEDVMIEKVLPLEILVNSREAVYGEPHTLHQVKTIHREQLKIMYPDHADKIDELSVPGGVDGHNDMVEVYMTWKKQYKEDVGQYVIWIENEILKIQDYTRDYFPFVVFKWTNLPTGFFGAGIAEEIADIQIEMNDLIQVAQDSIHLTELPKIFAEENSNVNPQHFDDEVGTIIWYRGPNPPQYANTGATSEVLLRQIENLYNKAFELTGISRLSAQATKPQGLNSGVALREFNDIESERFYMVEKGYENCYIKAAHMMIDIVTDIFTKKKDYEVKVAGKQFLKRIKWKDVNLSEDRYQMEIFSANFLPRTPAGRIEKSTGTDC